MSWSKTAVLLLSFFTAVQKGSALKVAQTFYGFPDNDPAGPGILLDCGRGYEASGTGTFDDPLTFATAPGQFEDCEIIYDPTLQKYLIHEDYCQACDTDWSKGLWHIDVWVGQKNYNGAGDQISCENRLTSPPQKYVVRNPDPDLPVDTTPLYEPGRFCKADQAGYYLSLYEYDDQDFTKNGAANQASTRKGQLKPPLPPVNPPPTNVPPSNPPPVYPPPPANPPPANPPPGIPAPPVVPPANPPPVSAPPANPPYVNPPPAVPAPVNVPPANPPLVNPPTNPAPPANVPPAVITPATPPPVNIPASHPPPANSHPAPVPLADPASPPSVNAPPVKIPVDVPPISTPLTKVPPVSDPPVEDPLVDASTTEYSTEDETTMQTSSTQDCVYQSPTEQDSKDKEYRDGRGQGHWMG